MPDNHDTAERSRELGTRLLVCEIRTAAGLERGWQWQVRDSETGEVVAKGFSAKEETALELAELQAALALWCTGQDDYERVAPGGDYDA